MGNRKKIKRIRGVLKADDDINPKDSFIAIDADGVNRYLNNTGVDEAPYLGYIPDHDLELLNSEEERRDSQEKFKAELNEQLDELFWGDRPATYTIEEEEDDRGEQK